jgi:phytoene/squalene synthetase
MNTDNHQDIVELPLAFRLAENLARKRSPKAWLTLSLLIPRARLKYLFLCYAYLRWVDDVIDNNAVGKDEKKKFIDEQIELLLSISNKKNVILKTNQEAFLYYFISFAIINNKLQLLNELEKMLGAMKMDVQRLENHGIFSMSHLSSYISFQTEAMFELAHLFLLPDDKYDGMYKKLGEFFWYAAALRDFKKDLECGYINISKEDLNNYEIDIEHYNEDENLKKWLKDRVALLFRLLESEVKILNDMPFKIRLFWSIAYPFYLHKIIKIKMYGYTFDYEAKFNFLKEIKSVMAALTLGIGTILKIVF